MQPTKEQMQRYLQRFAGTKPLNIYPLDPYPAKCKVRFVESEIYLEHGTSSIANLDRNKKYNIIAGFDKAKLEDFSHYDWLLGGIGGIPDLFSKRLVEIMNKICPQDFIALNVTLINLSNKVEPYENKDFYIINALNTVNAIDREKSIISYAYPRDKGTVDKRIYKDNFWQDHLVVFESNIPQMIWHPKLAKALYPSKQFQFLTVEEDNYWGIYEIPEGYDKESWADYLDLKQKMAYPGPRLAKSLNLAGLLKELE